MSLKLIRPKNEHLMDGEIIKELRIRWEFQHENFSVLAWRFQTPGGKPTFTYRVKRVGDYPSTFQHCESGYATTERGLKSAISKAINNLNKLK